MLCAGIWKSGGLAEGLLSLRSEVGGKGERMALFLSLGFDARVAAKLDLWRCSNNIFFSRLHQQDVSPR